MLPVLWLSLLLNNQRQERKRSRERRAWTADARRGGYAGKGKIQLVGGLAGWQATGYLCALKQGQRLRRGCRGGLGDGGAAPIRILVSVTSGDEQRERHIKS